MEDGAVKGGMLLALGLSGCQERREHGNQPQKLAKLLSYLEDDPKWDMATAMPLGECSMLSHMLK